MRAVWMVIGLMAATGVCAGQGAAAGPAAEDPGKLVREVVYNELHDHAQHGYFRYWIQRNSRTGTSLTEQIETVDGPVERRVENNGKPLEGREAQEEEGRLEALRNSAAQQTKQREAYEQDEQRIGKILALLPDAFVYRDAGVQDGVRHLHFTPNPSYSARGVEARVFHSMSGDLWIDLRNKRMQRLEGRLDENVEFGFGLLGRVDKGSWFRMVRTPVSPTEWKTEEFELHVSARALMLKTLARNTSEQRGGFAAVSAHTSLAQGLAFLEDAAAVRVAAARVAPAGLSVKR